MQFARTLLIGLAVLAAATVRGADDGSEYEQRWAARETENARLLHTLGSLKPTRFYRLDGSMKPVISPTTVLFHGQPVLASGAPKNSRARKDFKASLGRVLESSNGAQSACFFPRHGVTLSDGKQQFDILLCFECDTFFVHDAQGKVLYQSGFHARDEAARWNEAFDAAGATLPPRATRAATP